MKSIITLLLTLCISVSYADTLKISAVDQPVTQREVYNDVKQVIKQLAEGFSTTSEHVYVILVRQAIVKGVTAGLFFVLLCVLLTIHVTKVFKYATGKIEEYKNSEYYRDYDGWRALQWVPLILLSLGIFAYCFFMPEILTMIINPEYYAIQEILELLK